MPRWAAFTALGLVMATVACGTCAVFAPGSIAPIAAFAFAAITSVFALNQDPAQRFSNRLRKSQGDFSPMNVKIAPDGVVETTALQERRASWDQVTEVMEGKDVIVFRTAPDDGIVVPKRAFRSARAADMFLRTAEAYRDAATGNSDAVWPPVPKV